MIRKKNNQNPEFHVNKIRKKKLFLWKNARQKSLSGFYKKKERK